MVRIHEGRHSNQEIKKSLKAMGLNQKYEGVFMKLDEDSLRKLRTNCYLK